MHFTAGGGDGREYNAPLLPKKEKRGNREKKEGKRKEGRREEKKE